MATLVCSLGGACITHRDLTRVGHALGRADSDRLLCGTLVAHLDLAGIHDLLWRIDTDGLGRALVAHLHLTVVSNTLRIFDRDLHSQVSIARTGKSSWLSQRG